jgi:hypothetical protein
MRKIPKGLFPVAEEYRFVKSLKDGMYSKFEATGEYRNPLKGEWFLSGAFVAAYIAPNDLTFPYCIARFVETIICPHCNGSGKVKRKNNERKGLGVLD